MAEIQNSNVFSTQNWVISKNKKKRSSPKFRAIFLPISQVQTYEGGLFSYGGAVFHFPQKIGLKSTKNMRFCILYKPMGGARAPPAPPWLRYWVYLICLKYNSNFASNLSENCRLQLCAFLTSHSQKKNAFVYVFATNFELLQLKKIFLLNL